MSRQFCSLCFSDCLDKEWTWTDSALHGWKSCLPAWAGCSVGWLQLPSLEFSRRGPSGSGTGRKWHTNNCDSLSACSLRYLASNCVWCTGAMHVTASNETCILIPCNETCLVYILSGGILHPVCDCNLICAKNVFTVFISRHVRYAFALEGCCLQHNSRLFCVHTVPILSLRLANCVDTRNYHNLL